MTSSRRFSVRDRRSPDIIMGSRFASRLKRAISVVNEGSSSSFSTSIAIGAGRFPSPIRNISCSTPTR